MSEPSPLEVYVSAILGKSDDSQYHLGPQPYPGLRHFDTNDGDLLMARNASARRIRRRFGNNHIVVVIGGSGSGKSSLVRGRMLHDIASLAHPIGNRNGAWYAVTFRPVVKPVTQFVHALWTQIFKPLEQRSEVLRNGTNQTVSSSSWEGTTSLRPSEKEMAALIKGEPNSGFISSQQLVDRLDDDFWEGLRSGPANLMVVIDQFEEVFRSKVDRHEQKQLFDMILRVYQDKPEGVYIALIMRAEDLHRCAQFKGLADIVNNSFYLVDWLNDDELRSAIVGPARNVLKDWGVNPNEAPFDKEVIDLLLREVTDLKKQLQHKSDHLPLLQHSLRMLWKAAVSRWDTEIRSGGKPLAKVKTEDAKRTFGHLHGVEAGHLLRRCLNSEADKTFAQAVAEYDRITRQLSQKDSHVAVSAETAIRGAFCEMAALDELRRYHREYATIPEITEKRFPGSDTVFTAALSEALDVFVKSGLLVVASSGTETSFDVIHEALIRNWRRLSQWVEVDAQIAKVVNDATLGPTTQIRSDDRPTLDRILDPKGTERQLFTEAWITAAIENGSVAVRDMHDKGTPRELASYRYGKLKAAWLQRVQEERQEQETIKQKEARDRLLEKEALQARAAAELAETRAQAQEARALQASADATLAKMKAEASRAKTRSTRTILALVVFAGFVTLVSAYQWIFAMRANVKDYEMLDPSVIAQNAIRENLSSPQIGRELLLASTYYLRLDEERPELSPRLNAAAAHRTIDSAIRDLLGNRLHMVNVEKSKPPPVARKNCFKVKVNAGEGDPTPIGTDESTKAEFVGQRGVGSSTAKRIVVWPNQRGGKPIAFVPAPIEAEENDEICLWSNTTLVTLVRPNAPFPKLFHLSWSSEANPAWLVNSKEIILPKDERYKSFNDVWGKQTGPFKTEIYEVTSDSETMKNTIKFGALGHTFTAQYFSVLERIPTSGKDFEERKKHTTSFLMSGFVGQHELGGKFSSIINGKLIVSRETVSVDVFKGLRNEDYVDKSQAILSSYTVKVYYPDPKLPILVNLLNKFWNEPTLYLEDKQRQPASEITFISDEVSSAFVDIDGRGNIALYTKSGTQHHRILLTPNLSWISGEMSAALRSTMNIWVDDKMQVWSRSCTDRGCPRIAKELKLASPWI